MFISALNITSIMEKCLTTDDMIYDVWIALKINVYTTEVWFLPKISDFTFEKKSGD